MTYPEHPSQQPPQAEDHPSGGCIYGPPPPLPSKFAGLAVASLVLGLIGAAFSWVPIFDIITMIAAIIGGIMGAVALFGTRKVMAGFGVGLTVLAIIITAVVMNRVSSDVSAVAPSVAAPDGSRTHPASNSQQPFGQTFHYGDGTTIEVDAPAAYQPSNSAYVPSGSARAVSMRVAIVNGTAKPLNLVEVTIQASAGDQAVQEIIDVEKGIGTQSQTLPPGARQVFTIAFGVPAEHSDFRVQVEPGFLDQPAFYVGKI